MSREQGGEAPSIAGRLVRGGAIPRATKPAQWIELGRALNAEVRSQYGLGPDIHTVAVGWTSVPGLEARRFVGASRRIRERSPLPSPVPHINAPRTGYQFIDHAEQDVANAFIDALQGSSLRPDVESETLWIYVTHARGPCKACMQGLTNRDVPPGVLAQLSLRYPGLLVVLTWETAGHRLGSLIVQDGERRN